MAVNIVDVFVNDKYKQRTLSPQTNMYDTKNTCRAGMLKNGKEKGVVCHALHNGCGDSFAGTRHTLRKEQWYEKRYHCSLNTQRIDAATPKYICTQKQNERAIRQNESPNVKTKA